MRQCPYCLTPLETGEDCECDGATIAKLKAALRRISRLAGQWDANRLGGVSIQRRRWQRLGEMATAALGE